MKIPNRSGVCVEGEWQRYTRPSPPLCKSEGLKDIGHSLSIGNLILGIYSVTVSYLICYDSLLQNVTDIITKCDSYFITKCDSFITTCDSYYKMLRLLEIAFIRHLLFKSFKKPKLTFIQRKYNRRELIFITIAYSIYCQGC